MKTPDGWAWFDEPGDGPADDTPDLFARCFAGRDGERVLACLRAATLERTLSPAATDAVLRDLEGQRRLVASILALVARGRGNASHPDA